MNTKFFMDNRCFACGSENPNGLKMIIKESAEGVESIIKLPLWCQGYKKTVHGGIISTILDEMAVWAALKKKGLKCATAELNVRIKNGMKFDDEYIAKGKVTNVKHKLVQAESEIINKNKELIAFAKAKLIRID